LHEKIWPLSPQVGTVSYVNIKNIVVGAYTIYMYVKYSFFFDGYIMSYDENGILIFGKRKIEKFENVYE